jgi:hypothetical protein
VRQVALAAALRVRAVAAQAAAVAVRARRLAAASTKWTTIFRSERPLAQHRI